MRILLLLCAFSLTVSLSACSKKEEAPRGSAQKAQPAAGQMAKGSSAPEFTLQDLDGKQHRLSDYRGKVVLLNFWATWCPPCREEIPSMMKLNKLMAGKPFVMLCASIDEEGKKAVQAYFAKTNTSLLTLLDTDRSVATLYGATGVPETFVIDKNGIVQEKAVGALNWTDPQIVTYLNNLLAQ